MQQKRYTQASQTANEYDIFVTVFSGRKHCGYKMNNEGKINRDSI
jgi:hypothetical protein